jgi:3-hydroxyisobutyrate dehydrogenase-like beta-hydroxyacid dehydrogenase
MKTASKRLLTALLTWRRRLIHGEPDDVHEERRDDPVRGGQISCARMRVAFLGLGIMGSRMAANVAAAGHELSVWNRTQATALEFAARHGARCAQTPREAAAGAEIVITMVVDGPQLRSVLLEGEDCAASGAPTGTLFVDCETIGPAAALEIGAALAGRGMRMMDAPVTGSSPRAQDGTLTLMVGAEAEDLERARPVLEAMGSLIVHAGPLGQGQLVKVISNAVAACNATVVGQALIVGAGAGADLDALVQVMAAGAAGSMMLDLKARPMREHDYTPLFKGKSSSREEGEQVKPFFKTDQMLKDVRLALEQAGAAGVPFDLAQRAEELLAAAAAMSHGQDDFSSLIEPLEREAGYRLP